MFRSAQIGEYITWLDGYLAAGGQLTHCYDYPWQRTQFLVVNRDFRLGGECGSAARAIIVVPGVQHLGGDRGHNNLYFMDEYRLDGWWVPVYTDAAFDALPGVKDLKNEQRRKDAARRQEQEDRRREGLERQATSDLSRHLADRDPVGERMRQRAELERREREIYGY